MKYTFFITLCRFIDVDLLILLSMISLWRIQILILAPNIFSETELLGRVPDRFFFKCRYVNPSYSTSHWLEECRLAVIRPIGQIEGKGRLLR